MFPEGDSMEELRKQVLTYNRTLKNELKESIRTYQTNYPLERDPEIVLEFIEGTDNLFGRDSRSGHLTCSAWILNSGLSAVALVKHIRLGRWIQPGGHIEAFETPLEGAQREGAEETGILNLIPWSGDLFHISVHDFPEGKDGPRHYHYDLRYLFIAPENAELVGTLETDGVSWVGIDQLEEYTDELTITDMADKTKELIRQGLLISERMK